MIYQDPSHSGLGHAKSLHEHQDRGVEIAPQIFGDARGFFMATFRVDQFLALGLPMEFRQGNYSRSSKAFCVGCIFGGTHFRSKLMRVTRGAAFLVAGDILNGSPTLGKWFRLEVSAANKKHARSTTNSSSWPAVD
jgi:dTDP-4-dehydrorhamnose 3,5-epimerase